MDETLAKQIAGIAVLDDPVRRSLYLYVARQADAVSREAAAEATGASRENAAFHLDKLVEAGLLEASYRRLSGRTGPGAGRPSKVYRRSAQKLQLALPVRHYELAAELLAQALEPSRTRSASASVSAAAHRAGASLGAAARARSARGNPLRRLTQLLDRQGYEPTEAPRGVVRMRNCPFHEVAQSHPDVVCGMNLAFMEGIVAGAAADGVSATLDPQPGQCCVTLRAASPKPRT
ncbi:MAG: helix-turn-helix transcriptional regulator [Candidatus Limnocylindria bacterium]